MVIELTQVKKSNMDGYYVESLFIDPQSVSKIEPHNDPLLEERLVQKGVQAIGGYTSIRVDGENYIVIGGPKHISEKINKTKSRRLDG